MTMAAVRTAKEDAHRAGLRYADSAAPGITRMRRGRGFSFHAPSGDLIVENSIKERCRGLAVPPAYEDVWICQDPKGHLQATGRDARGRKAYIYHPDWQAFRNQKKYSALLDFGDKLGTARARNEEQRRGLAPRQGRILAAMFWLLDHHALRVGNEAYSKENGSFGATTLRMRHVEDDGAVLHFAGKSGKDRQVSIDDVRLRNLVRRLSDLPGQHLFQYQDEEGEFRRITSGEVNAYLHGLFGDDVSAKTFRTWHGSVAAFARGLEKGAKVDDVLGAASQRLGNTKAIVRNSYIHPAIIDAVKEGSLEGDAASHRIGRHYQGFSAEESWFFRWLKKQEKA